MDIRYNFEMANVTEEDINNLFGMITGICKMAQESSMLSEKMNDLRSKVSDLERDNRKLTSEKADLEYKIKNLKEENSDLQADLDDAEADLREAKKAAPVKAAVKVKPAKKPTSVTSFNEVDDDHELY